jgi:hypothetical protein
MPGTARQKSETAIFHVWLRGIDKPRTDESGMRDIIPKSEFKRQRAEELIAVRRGT